MSGKRKLDRGQPELRPGDLEREAGGDLAAPQYHTGGVQGRRSLDGHPRYQRRAPSHRLRPAGAVLCDGHRQNLLEFYGIEETRNGVQVLYSLYSRSGGGDPWHGTDDGALQGGPGDDLYHHDGLRDVGAHRYHPA